MGFKFNPLTGELDLVNGLKKKIVRAISPGSTDVSDINLSSSLFGASYTISAKTNDNTKSKTLVCIVSNNSLSINDQVGFKTGSLKLDVNNVINGANHNLIIKNNETQNITVTIEKNVF